jgi:integrase
MRGARRRGSSGAIQANVTVDGRTWWRTFPAGTAPEVVAAWRANQRLIRSQLAAAGRQTPGTLGEAVHAYLGAKAAMPTYRERVRHLELWVVALGGEKRLRETVTPLEIAAVLQGWLLTGLAPQTVRLRRTALANLWTVLDGRGAPNPVKSVPVPRTPPPGPRAIPVALVQQLLAAMGDTQSRARLMVLATTGLPHSQIAQITAEDVDAAIATKVLAVGPRRKGRGAPGRAIPVTPEVSIALEALRATGALGRFSSSSLRKAFLRACKKAGLPSDLRPYDLRHTVGTELYRATQDLRTVGRLLGHTDLRTTERYARAALLEADTEAMGNLPKVLPKAEAPRKRLKLVRGGKR